MTQTMTYTMTQTMTHKMTHNDINDENLARTLNKNKDTITIIYMHKYTQIHKKNAQIHVQSHKYT